VKGKLYYHKCGYPVILAKQQLGVASKEILLDGKDPVGKDKKGKSVPHVIEICPECKGSIQVERLLSKPPEKPKDEEKRSSGYIKVV
jgi:hypothetical protein